MLFPKGSGFGKIISGYEFQINYNESKRPSFRSDRYQFTVVMPNLNYDVPQDVPQNKLDTQIVDLIRKDSKISTEKIAITLGVSSKTIKRHIKELVSKKFALLKKPMNPSRFRTHPAVPELSALCIILAVFLKGGKNVSADSA